jgi:hypothetical protein
MKAELERTKKPSPLPALLPPALITPSSSSSSESNSTSTLDLQATISSLQMQLGELQSRYDRLSEAKAKAAARHRADYNKWKDFKDWLYKSSTGGSLAPANGALNISPKKRKAIVAGITERKVNPKKPRNQTIASLDFLSTPLLPVSEPPTPGPSTMKASDPSDTDDHEMDTTDESVRHTVPFILILTLSLFSSKSDPVTEAEITLVNKEDSEDGVFDPPA